MLVQTIQCWFTAVYFRPSTPRLWSTVPKWVHGTLFIFNTVLNINRAILSTCEKKSPPRGRDSDAFLKTDETDVFLFFLLPPPPPLRGATEPKLGALPWETLVPALYVWDSPINPWGFAPYDAQFPFLCYYCGCFFFLDSPFNTAGTLTIHPKCNKMHKDRQKLAESTELGRHGETETLVLLFNLGSDLIFIVWRRIMEPPGGPESSQSLPEYDNMTF